MNTKQNKKIFKNPTSIFITGASSGLGKALAIEYAAPNTDLFLCGRNAERLKETSDICREKGATVHNFLFDVSNPKETEQALNDAHKLCPLHLVIANAGISGGVLGVPETAAATRHIMETNINGVLNTVLPASQILKKQGFGQIALVSSLAGYRGMAGCPAYSASKSFVKAWGEGLRGFLKKSGIQVNVICPGFIETPLTDKNAFPMPFKMKADKAAKIIRRRLGRNQAVISFPWQMALGAYIGSALPSWIILPILERLPKKEL